MAVPTEHLDTLTNKHFVKRLVDQFFLRSVFLMKLRAMEKPFDGGKDIRIPVSYKKSSIASAWSGGVSTLDASHQPHTTQAIFDIPHYYTSITVPVTEQWLNSGEAKIVDILEAQSELAESSLIDTMGTDAYGAGANDSNGNKTLDGLQGILTRNADPSVGAYGSISRASSDSTKATGASDNSWWNGQTYAANANGSVNFWKGAETIGNTTAVTLAKLQQQFGLTCDGPDRPDLILVGQLVFNALHALQTQIQRQDSADKVGRAGFQTLEFNGVPVVVDDLINAVGTVYMLNMKHIKLMPNRKGNFYTTPFRQPTNQLVNIKYIVFQGNMVCDKPRLQSSQTGFTS